MHERKGKKENGDDIKKKTAMATTPLLFFILLHNLEADTQRMRVLIPIRTEQYKLANLSR